MLISVELNPDQLILWRVRDYPSMWRTHVASIDRALIPAYLCEQLLELLEWKYTLSASEKARDTEIQRDVFPSEICDDRKIWDKYPFLLQSL